MVVGCFDRVEPHNLCKMFPYRHLLLIPSNFTREILMMTKGKIGYFIIVSAIIWGAVVLGCSLKLTGTECYDEISYILSIGAVSHLLFVWGPLAGQYKSKKNDK